MNKLVQYLRPYRKEVILAPLFKLLEASMELAVPLVVARIINQGILDKDSGVILSSFALLLLFALLGMLFSFTSQWFSAKASVGFTTVLRQKLFDHIQGFSYAQQDKMGTDSMITRLTSDINQVQTGVNTTLRLALRSPFVVFGAMVMAFTIDVPSALVFAVAIPLLSVVVFGIMWISIPLFTKVQAALDQLLGTTRENLTGVRVIRAFGKEEDEKAEFKKRNDRLTALTLFVGRLSAVMNPTTFLMINIATIILIYIGAVRVDAGIIQQGSVVAMYNYMAQIIVELVKLASLIITINKSMACAQRISDVLETSEGMTYPVDKGQKGDVHSPAVVFENVSFTYAASSLPALEHLNLRVEKGQTIGVIGGTGSGKSTLVNLIPRFYDVTDGRILVQGLDVKDYPQGALIEKIDLVPQKAVLFEGTIRDNLLWGNETASDEDLWEALSLAQAKDVVEGKEGQLDAAIEQNGRNLSGGQRQRLTIARALVKKPDILILDDSSSALDFATDLRLRQAIASLKDMTVFIVSQRTSSVNAADQIVVLDDGDMVGLGSHEALLATNKTYQEIYYSQFPDELKKEEKEAEA